MKEQEVPETPTITPLPPLNRKERPLLIALGLLIILSVAVFAGIQIGKKQNPKTPSEILFNQPTVPVTPTLDPTEGWKTYTNNKYHFSLKYPSDWEISLGPISESSGKPMYTLETIEEEGAIKFYDPSSARDMQTIGNANEIYVSVNKDVLGKEIDCNGLSLGNCVRLRVKPNNPYGLPLPSGTLPDFVEIVCGRKSGLGRAIIDSNISGGPRNRPGIKSTDFYFMENGDLVHFVMVVENWPKRYEATFAIFDQILSTFKFLE